MIAATAAHFPFFRTRSVTAYKSVMDGAKQKKKGIRKVVLPLVMTCL